MKMSFHLHADKTHFHMKGFARSLALKKRHKTIRKWPIVLVKDQQIHLCQFFVSGDVKILILFLMTDITHIRHINVFSVLFSNG